jgi:hypothetical protein
VRFFPCMFSSRVSSHACHNPCPSHPYTCDHPNSIWWAVKSCTSVRLHLLPLS